MSVPKTGPGSKPTKCKIGHDGIYDLYKNGRKVKQIAKELHVCESTVQRSIRIMKRFEQECQTLSTIHESAHTILS